MEQFSLEKWLQAKSRKVVTRDGRPVIIVCSKSPYDTIVGFCGKDQQPDLWDLNGKFLKDRDSDFDLFFADEEKELTELQKTLEEYCDYYVKLYNDGNTREELREWIKCWCHRIIDLARKEIEKENPYSGNQKQE